MNANAAAVLTKPAFARSNGWSATSRSSGGPTASSLCSRGFRLRLTRSISRPRWRNGRRESGSHLAGAARRSRPAMAQAVLWRGEAHRRCADAGHLNLKPRSRPPGRDPVRQFDRARADDQAAMQARIPAAPVSPAYSLMSQDHAKLKYLFDLIKPALVMVQDCPAFEKALNALDLDGVTVVHVTRPVTASRASPLPTSRRRRSRATSKSRSRRSRRIPSASCCSPRAPPACPRRSSIRSR